MALNIESLKHSFVVLMVHIVIKAISKNNKLNSQSNVIPGGNLISNVDLHNAHIRNKKKWKTGGTKFF
jgi:hypothetical protein